ncbi:hypothetical protein SAMN05444274_102256 [Mariniphaga anaerophila]|uniref:Outer membrane protein beta-barrel domain-containing protein n=1 Tax=Mariniphaga anaerophila TaxID=1484053 RepID=A0A1M4VZ94_9BACT|nr:hypothetical protein [Mariniphaga anaerophila]SHE74220.1 hypothetical protein SAMN05444274_102256 [Mariniphaga anaerophila]
MKNILVLFLFFPLLISAQNITEEKTKQLTFGVGVVPQYAILNGMRIDFDYKLNDKNQWLVVAPQVYLSSDPNFTWDYNSMTGFGIELQHKVFLNKEFKTVNPYFAYGPTFNYFSVQDDGLTARSYNEDGGNYIGLVEDEMTTRIFKFGGNIILGLHYFLFDNLYMDAYVGTGIRFSYDNQTSGLHGYYNDWWADLGYSGTLMVGGIRFGVMF